MDTEIGTIQFIFNYAASFNRLEVRGASVAPPNKEKREKRREDGRKEGKISNWIS